MNKGCLVALISSVKALSGCIETQRGKMDNRAWRNAMAELSSMNDFMVSILNDRGLENPQKTY